MELLRIFERNCSKNAANIRRKRNCFKHVRIKKIYETANIDRFDNSVVNRTINFVEKCERSTCHKISGFLRVAPSGTYKPISLLNDLNSSGQLYENGKLLTFHRAYRGLVYNTDQ